MMHANCLALRCTRCDHYSAGNLTGLLLAVGTCRLARAAGCSERGGYVGYRDFGAFGASRRAELASPRERMGLCWCCCGEADVEPLLEDDDRRWERESAAAAASSIACVPSVGVSDFEVLSVLGRGAYGRVLQVRQRHTQELFAMKVMKKEDVVERNQIRHALTERALLGALRHPFIVPLHYAFDSESHLYLVLALMSGGELFFHLKRDGAFSEARARLYGAEILLALEALHQVRLSRCVSHVQSH